MLENYFETILTFKHVKIGTCKNLDLFNQKN